MAVQYWPFLFCTSLARSSFLSFSLSLSYHSPFGDLALGDLLDGHPASVAVPDAGVHGAEAALAQHLSDAVVPLEGVGAALLSKMLLLLLRLKRPNCTGWGRRRDGRPHGGEGRVRRQRLRERRRGGRRDQVAAGALVVVMLLLLVGKVEVVVRPLLAVGRNLMRVVVLLLLTDAELLLLLLEGSQRGRPDDARRFRQGSRRQGGEARLGRGLEDRSGRVRVARRMVKGARRQRVREERVEG